jgi:hypothetical protein
MRNRFLIGLAVAATLALSLGACATPVAIRTLDASGAPLENELIIVIQLSPRVEVFRALSDSKGLVPDRDLPRGLYRAIVTDPYGSWKTDVEEFVVGDAAVKLEFKIDPMGTHGYGDWIGSPQPELRVAFVTAAGQSPGRIDFLVRDEEALYELWRRTDADGKQTLSRGDWTALPFNGPLVIVALWRDRAVTRVFSVSEVEQSRSSHSPLVMKLD